MKTHKDLTTKKEYPKTIKVKTTYDGLYNFQVYHVYNDYEKSLIILNAYNNDFEGITLEDYQPEIKESHANWNNNLNEVNSTWKNFTDI